MPEKFQEDLQKAVKSLQIADHMTYVTFPLVNEQRLLLKIFDEIHKSIINCINAILNYEYLYKRIQLYANNGENIRTFANKCAKTYNLNNGQIKKILEILELNKKHKQSAMEFVKKDRVVILSDSLNTQTLDIHKIKQYLLLSKELLMEVNKRMKTT
jgi:hypothetical protein